MIDRVYNGVPSRSGTPFVGRYTPIRRSRLGPLYVTCMRPGGIGFVSCPALKVRMCHQPSTQLSPNSNLRPRLFFGIWRMAHWSTNSATNVHSATNTIFDAPIKGTKFLSANSLARPVTTAAMTPDIHESVRLIRLIVRPPPLIQRQSCPTASTRLPPDPIRVPE